MSRSIILLTLVFLSACASNGQKTPVAQTPQSKPFELGVIEEIQSNELAEKRTLNIYLPEGYNQNDTASYPVIYLLDGSADEDFIHVVGLLQYNNFSWIDRVPKSIVVGIANVDRRRDFSFPTTVAKEKEKYPTTGGSAKFIAFLEKELQPFIEKRYRTNASKTLIGQSLGGLLATEILYNKPALFNKYVIISPSLWWNAGSMLSQTPPDFKQPTDIYIGVGKEGSTPGFSDHTMEADAKTLADKIKALNNKNLRVWYDYLPAEDHATVSHPAIFNAFRLLYPKVK